MFNWLKAEYLAPKQVVEIEYTVLKDDLKGTISSEAKANLHEDTIKICWCQDKKFVWSIHIGNLDFPVVILENERKLEMEHSIMEGTRKCLESWKPSIQISLLQAPDEKSSWNPWQQKID